jgi:hypothetical protein
MSEALTTVEELDEDTRKLMLGAVVSYSHKLCDAIERGPQPPEQGLWQDLERCEILMRVLIRDTDKKEART